MLYEVAEQVVLHTSVRDRFFSVRTAPTRAYDVVLLGSSHATTFGFQDLNARLEDMVGTRVLNLSLPSAGILPNRVLLDYFLAERSTRIVVYFVDSFVFTSTRWNEGRFADPRFLARAPLDLGLACLLGADPRTRAAGVLYVSGLAKINGLATFAPDMTDDEVLRFGRVYSPSGQIDTLRMRNLYPDPPDAALAAHYLTNFDELARGLHERGITLILVKPPVTAQWYRMLPDEPNWDVRLDDLSKRLELPLYDFSLASPDEALYFDADHLNRAGVLTFFEQHLAPLLRGALAAG